MTKPRRAAPLALTLGMALSFECGSSSTGNGGTGGGGTGGGSLGQDAGWGDGSAATDGSAGAGGGDGATDTVEPPGGVGGSVGTSVLLADFPQTLAGAYCQRVSQCCTVQNFDPENCRLVIKAEREVQQMSYQPYLDA